MNKIKIEHFFNKEYQLNEEQKLYLKIHAKRFEIILSNITHQHSAKVLDIGPSFLSYLLYQKFGENLSLLGFNEQESFGGHLPDSSIFQKVNLIKQDLNFWKVNNEDQKFDLITCGEVIEHLYTSPHTLFDNFYKSLNKNGILIIQTPNAVSFRKRLALLFGKNPFEMPRENLSNPGHYREYTANELTYLASKNKLKVETVFLDEYFEYPSKTSKIYRGFKNLIPKNFRSGITIILKKND